MSYYSTEALARAHQEERSHQAAQARRRPGKRQPNPTFPGGAGPLTSGLCR
jgi:hypothetical protein